MMGGELETFCNFVKRSIRCPGLASARVRRGTMADDKRNGLGDCVIMDFKNGFFAIADSSDRDTTASRKFLMRYTVMLEDIAGALLEDVASREKLIEIRELLEKKSEDILMAIPYTSSCTFTGIFLPRNYSGGSGILLHTGDSMLYTYCNRSDELRRITENNFWMVGRTKQLFQIEEMGIEPDTVILIASDGFTDLNFSGYIERDTCIVDLIKDNAIEEVADILFERGYANKAPVDDLGLIALRPDSIYYTDKRVVMGGTSAFKEGVHDEKSNSGLYRDELVALGDDGEIELD
jgi:serine/threonine protein phosphatase PrpC